MKMRYTLVENYLIRCALSILLVSLALKSLPTLANSPQEEIEIVGSDYQLFVGESPDFEHPLFVSDTPGAFFEAVRKQDFSDVYWIRWTAEIISGGEPARDVEYYISALASFEVYWDGQLIGENGVVGKTKDLEEPGQIEVSFLVPNDLLTTGKHLHTFKLSSHYRAGGSPIFRHAFFKHFDTNSRFISLGSLLPTLLISISLIVGIYFMTLFLSDQKSYSHLIFFFLCINLFAFGMIIQWPHLVGFSYDWYQMNGVIGYITGILFPVLLPLFFLVKNQLTKYWPITLLVPLLLLISKFIFPLQISNKEYWILGLLLTVGILLTIVYKNKGKYWWELVSIVAAVATLVYVESALEDFFYIFPIIVIFVLLSNTLEAKKQRESAYQFQLKSSQLEAQLLRKNIQPHFILNSLASLVEWVETSPEKSIDFIASLADEFRLFAEVANKKTIALSKEIELCDKHLSIMAFRLQQEFLLDASEVIEGENIPPGIFHTLIENAFSHNDYSKSNVTFKVKGKLENRNYYYIFSSPILKQERISKYNHLGTGTGISYIRSQLNQGFGRRWEIEEYVSSGYWNTKITLKLKG